MESASLTDQDSVDTPPARTTVGLERKEPIVGALRVAEGAGAEPEQLDPRKPSTNQTAIEACGLILALLPATAPWR